MRRASSKLFGYSGTPLIDKLGIKPGARVQLVSEPTNFLGLLGGLPPDAKVAVRGALDFAILFVESNAELRKGFSKLRDRLESNGMLWVAWPKKHPVSPRISPRVSFANSVSTRGWST
jgi:hypothetical protein